MADQHEAHKKQSSYDHAVYDMSKESKPLYQIGRDDYDETMDKKAKSFKARHDISLTNAQIAEEIDADWIKDKDAVRQLNMNIRDRQHNHATYKNSLETEKQLFNRERHRTLLLSIANIFALSGCIFMWASGRK